MKIKQTGRAVVIGAGIGGLAASIRLAVKGYQVDVFDAGADVGGKMTSFTLGEFRFDKGPSLFTMPEQVTALFDLAGVSVSDYFQFEQVEDACTYYWPDGQRFRAASSPTVFAREAAQMFKVNEKDLLDYLAHAQKLLESTGDIFLKKSLKSSQTWFDSSVLTALLTLKASDLLYPMHRLNQLRIKEPHLVQLFDRFATYNGSDPYRTPGLMTMIAALEHGQGTFFPKGGMLSIPKSLERLARDLGVSFHCNTYVNQILYKGRKVTGIQIGERTIDADLVLSDMDIWYTYRRLLPDFKAPEHILNQERSSSAMVFYWGINRSFPQLGLHNIFFSGDYRQEFEMLFKKEGISGDPTVYVHISSKIETVDAPPGKENWFVMVNTPRHTGQDWNLIAQKVKAVVIKKLSHLLNIDLALCIEEEAVWDPSGIEQDTLSYQGALYGNSSNTRFAAFLRHGNQNPSLDGLFHVGGTVHPGGGIPLCLLSARIATELI